MTDPRWIHDVLAEPLLDEWRDEPVYSSAFIELNPHFDASLILKRHGSAWVGGYVYLWSISLSFIVAAGNARILSERPDVLEICSSAVTCSWRGRGIYTRVLRVLSKLHGGPIESATLLSPAAANAWKHAGGVWTTRDSSPVLRIGYPPVP